ncbi:MAG: hypothetical protein A2508_06915 [Candidatus Lambdaproteobacteria bacterium RIFOXYD12_FULL_49_8]|uniref:Uncharacterized protein n=1 Tax=Candidatus Lambdaproteobacteria bacterium RIFOXYD2_FULL_50_16 TaxID=1817772 RepID=A0A1F6GBK0_9PROT|nr:MAG: hypothetical protein A2527_07170 [Candidatus Lambdaproteobacteria bacterium RIFOXYD2_FULL_50_16]OGG98083.1 MAG: hypothetical protein A2508_06915 [Candidatus Lambdaproteobacteria bacterium RIFOXYD12_FULL_49_8]
MRTKKELCNRIEHYLRMRIPNSLRFPEDSVQTLVEQYREGIRNIPIHEKAHFFQEEKARLEAVLKEVTEREQRWSDFVRQWAIQFSHWIFQNTPILEIRSWSWSKDREPRFIEDDLGAQLEIIQNFPDLSPKTPLITGLIPAKVANEYSPFLQSEGVWILEAANEVLFEFARIGFVSGSSLKTVNILDFLETLYLAHWRDFSKNPVPPDVVKRQLEFVEQQLIVWGRAKGSAPNKAIQSPEKMVFQPRLDETGLDLELLFESRIRNHPIPWLKSELAKPLFLALVGNQRIRVDNLGLALLHHRDEAKNKRLKVGNRLFWLGDKSDLIHLQNALQQLKVWDKGMDNKILEENFAFLNGEGERTELKIESDFSNLRSKINNGVTWGNQPAIFKLVKSLLPE